MNLTVTGLLHQDMVSSRLSCVMSCIHTHVNKIGVDSVMLVVKDVLVIVESVTRGSVSFSDVSEGDRSTVSGHGQLKGVLSAVLYTYTYVQD